MHTRRNYTSSHPMSVGYSEPFDGLGSWWTQTRDSITGAAKQQAAQAQQQIQKAADQAKAQVQQQATAVVQGAVQKVGQQAASTIQSKVAQISTNPLVQKFTGQAVDKTAAGVIAEKIEPVVSTVRKNIKPIAIVAAIGIAYLIFRKR